MNAARSQVAMHASTPQPSAPLLRISGLSAGFGVGRVLSGVDLAINPGELVALTGEPDSGKTTLVRCIAGDIAPEEGMLEIDGQPLPPDAAAVDDLGVAVLWQDLTLCDNLDVAANLLLGQETRRMMLSPTRLHTTAAEMLKRLDIPIHDTTQPVGRLSGAQRQLVALAKAIGRGARMVVLDEPTASLGAVEAAQVEELIGRLHDAGTTILLVSRDTDQMFRLAQRIVVLRDGQPVAELDPRTSHPDDVAALLSGQQVDTSARRQLTRLHGLADRLVSADPSSSLSLILSALGPALGTEHACIHVVNEGTLECADAVGFLAEEVAPWAQLPFGPDGGPPGIAAQRGERVIVDLRDPGAWAGLRQGPGRTPPLLGSWSVPVMTPGGVSAVITVFMPTPAAPERDELDLLTLYGGYAASTVERDRLLEQVTARNRVLETLREVLETLAGPVHVSEGLGLALDSLRRGLRADEVGLLTRLADGRVVWRAYSGQLGTDPQTMSETLRVAAARASANGRRDGSACELGRDLHRRVLAVPFSAPHGPGVLLAAWEGPAVSEQETALIEDAAHSLRLALEREEAAIAHQEAAALRRSRQLQRGFLSMLSHELRTPLTAVRGYASSLLAPDVTWDGDSQQRFLERIAAESARLGRLVDDLLDFSSIESGLMRLQPDWCDIPLVLQAAVGCLPAEWSDAVKVVADPELPALWADHDRLEQVFVNLLNNAFRHNPPGTAVEIVARHHAGSGSGAHEIEIRVADDGPGFPEEFVESPFETTRKHRSRSAGAGLGLSISRGIVDAHGGTIALEPSRPGTTFAVRLPVEGSGGIAATGDPPEPPVTEELMLAQPAGTGGDA
jgi:signal transduction histidine kinase/ABC-type multidrug transport system ATPase subunit